jgi:hypothetical protein
VVEELEAAGLIAHLAEPAETSAARGPKKRAKTDGADAKHLRELVEAQRLWESWIPPAHGLDLREVWWAGRSTSAASSTASSTGCCRTCQRSPLKGRRQSARR